MADETLMKMEKAGQRYSNLLAEYKPEIDYFCNELKSHAGTLDQIEYEVSIKEIILKEQDFRDYLFDCVNIDNEAATLNAATKFFISTYAKLLVYNYSYLIGDLLTRTFKNKTGKPNSAATVGTSTNSHFGIEFYITAVRDTKNVGGYESNDGHLELDSDLDRDLLIAHTITIEIPPALDFDMFNITSIDNIKDLPIRFRHDQLGDDWKETTIGELAQDIKSTIVGHI